MDARLATYPIAIGYLPQRWRESINIMIPKRVNSFDMSKLRIIHLWNADANLNCKAVAHKIMKEAELIGGLAPE